MNPEIIQLHDQTCSHVIWQSGAIHTERQRWGWIYVGVALGKNALISIGLFAPSINISVDTNVKNSNGFWI